MGMFLAVGLALRTQIRKGDVAPHVSQSDLEKALARDVNLAHYDWSEDDSKYCLSIKPNLLEGDFEQFYSDILKMYSADDKFVKERVDCVASMKSGKERIDMAMKRQFQCFESLDSVYDSCSLVDDQGKEIFNFRHNGVDIWHDFLIFFCEGKIVMECYDSLFAFFEKNIRNTFRKYDVAGSVRVMMVG